MALETKKEGKKSMSKNSNRRGLALGAMFSLVATLFVGATPASANVSTTAFFFAPTKGSSYAVFVDHDFHMTVQRNSAVVSATDFATLLKYEISTDRKHSASTFSLIVAAGTTSEAVNTIQDSASYALSRSANTIVNLDISGSQRIFYGGAQIQNPAGYHSNLVIPPLEQGKAAPTQSFVVNPQSRSATVTNWIGLQLQQHGANGVGLYPNSSSPTVVVTVRAFLDKNGDNVYQALSEESATQTVTFTKYSAAAPTVTLDSLSVGDTQAVARVSLAASTINLNQTDGKWGVRFEQHLAGGRNNSVSYSNPAERSLTFADGAGLSMSVSNSITAAAASRTVSAFAIFFRDNGSFGDAGPALALNLGGHGSVDENFDNTGSQSQVIAWEYAIVTTTPATVGASAVSLYAVVDNNVTRSSIATTGGFATAGKSLVRSGGRTFTVRLSTSDAVSGATATFTFSNPTLTAFKTYTVDGGTQITANTFSAVTKVLSSAGVASITITTVGFSNGDVLTVSALVSGVGGEAYQLGLYIVNPVYTVFADTTELAIAPGGTANVGVTVKDQFGVNSTAVDQRIRFEWTAGYNGTSTRSDVALVSARATAAMVHVPATSTVAGAISATLQDSTGGVFGNTTGATNTSINVTITSATNGFRVGLAKSYSATISYGADYSWSPVINDAFVIVTGSSVVVSGTGLIFKDDVSSAISSDTITLLGDSAARVKFYVTARKAGSYTVTLTAGTATTTSLIVVSAAQDNAGSAIAFDVSSMESGKAAIITGTLTDRNGNPVDTTLGNATIALGVAGTGATFVGSLTAETNADGKFQVALLSGTSQTGTMTVTAVYSPTSGAAAADKVTKVHTVTVVAPAVPEANAVIGSFNGRWAVRVENAKGSVVSVKYGKKWTKFSALNNNYLYSLKAVKGSTIAISVWVDGELQNSQTINIK
jgi:hypothetical protein